MKGLSSDEMKLAKEIRDNEDEHVDALAATVKKLGGTPVKKPTFDFGGAFGGRAVFLKTANTLEDAGVSAYNGGGPLIASKDVLAAAGSIVQVEARHAALIRLSATSRRHRWRSTSRPRWTRSSRRSRRSSRASRRSALCRSEGPGVWPGPSSSYFAL